VCCQVLGLRFDVLLTSYETVLKDKAELKRLNYAVRRNHLSLALVALAAGCWSAAALVAV
jgi:hypothetical protein